MKKNSRFDCLREDPPKNEEEKRENKKGKKVNKKNKRFSKEHLNEEKPPGDTVEPKPTPIEPSNTIKQSNTIKEKPKSTPWLDRIKGKVQDESDEYPPRGWVSYRYDKKTHKTRVVYHPDDIKENKKRELQKEKERELEKERLEYEAYLRYRSIVIRHFIEDLEMGRPTMFDTVEEYIEYLDRDEEEEEEEDEEQEEEEEYDSNEEIN